MSERSVTQIKAAGTQDIEMVRDLVRRAYAKWVPVIGREPMPMQADYAGAIREHDIDLLYMDGKLVVLIETIVASDHLFIENVAVAPEHQGRGFGRRLLNHAEHKARDARVSELRLLTNAAFAENIRLYQGFGFQIDRAEPFMGGMTTHMSKIIR